MVETKVAQNGIENVKIKIAVHDKKMLYVNLFLHECTADLKLKQL